VLTVNQAGSTFLFDLHFTDIQNGRALGSIFRIGEMFLVDTNVGTNFELFRDGNGNRIAGITDAEFKIYNGTYFLMTSYDDTHLLVLKDTDELTLLDITQ